MKIQENYDVFTFDDFDDTMLIGTDLLELLYFLKEINNDNYTLEISDEDYMIDFYSIDNYDYYERGNGYLGNYASDDGFIYELYVKIKKLQDNKLYYCIGHNEREYDISGGFFGDRDELYSKGIIDFNTKTIQVQEEEADSGTVFSVLYKLLLEYKSKYMFL